MEAPLVALSRCLPQLGRLQCSSSSPRYCEGRRVLVMLVAVRISRSDVVVRGLEILGFSARSISSRLPNGPLQPSRVHTKQLQHSTVQHMHPPWASSITISYIHFELLWITASVAATRYPKAYTRFHPMRIPIKRRDRDRKSVLQSKSRTGKCATSYRFHH